MLAEYGERVTTVAEYVQLHAATTRVVAEADAEDVESAQRREGAQFWRERLPGAMELLG